ncbi:hypothetical protein [Marinitoga sp. 38H-ov]|uniref:hypothetical protein n=1 Tax=Marinitoga sp. 38H-ov TaxID=1755814 RepID=UPI0013E9D3C8|nr:hypothetical protein [Marinitoga sp. 38H-ov]KAF2956766.1 hypothetical protein AS160_04165 [Marinitoga sp. 38H-ov]
MFKKGIFYILILLFISIISTLYPNINNIISRVNYPLDIVFSDIRNNYLLLTKNNNFLKDLEKQISNNTITFEIKNENYELNISLIPGIIINEDIKYYYVKSDNNVKTGEIAFTNEGILLGFVENTFKKNKIVRKLGWGNNELYGNYNGYEFLIKESGNGYIIIEIPEGFSIFQNNENVNILISNSNWFKKNIILKGTVYIKGNNLYYFEPYKNDNTIVFFSEFGVK